MIFVRRRSRAKPPPGAKLDWSHPLTIGLISYFVCNEGGGTPRDLVRDRGSSAEGTWGSGMRGVTCRNWQCVPALSEDVDITSGPWSVAAGFQQGAAHVAGQYAEVLKHRNYVNETTNQGWALRILSNSENVYAFEVYRNGSAASYRLTSTSPQDAGANKHHTIVGTSSGSLRILYFDGQKQNSTANNTNPLASTAEGIGQSTPVSDGTSWGGVWSRELTPQEALWLHAEPYDFLINPAPLRKFFMRSSSPNIVFRRSFRGIRARSRAPLW